MSPHLEISTDFDGGNIHYVRQSVDPSDGSLRVHLEVKPDPYTELEKRNHLQYFAFCSKVVVKEDGDDQHHHEDGEEDHLPIDVTYIIDNASKTSYPIAWTGSTVMFAPTLDDDDAWRRNQSTQYQDGVLAWKQSQAIGSSMYYCYFPPYSHQRHLDFIERCRASERAQVDVLGQSLDGRDMECITLGRGERTCWIIHRQHPGETQAEFFAEGLLTRLLGLDGELDELATNLLDMYTFHIVPCMCPDGGARGHLRTNAAGANLNREWTSKGDYTAPTLERSPEVYHVLKKMDETGVDVCLDVHADEELPYNFIAGAELVPTWSPRLQALHGAFLASFARANSDFQQKIGYPPPDTPEDALKYLNVATNQIATRFNCLSMTLEMPFKDCESNPDPKRGWSIERCRRLGASVLHPLAYVHPHLREKEEDLSFPEEDAYIQPTDQYQYQNEDDDGFFQPLHKRMYSDVRSFGNTNEK